MLPHGQPAVGALPLAPEHVVRHRETDDVFEVGHESSLGVVENVVGEDDVAAVIVRAVAELIRPVAEEEGRGARDVVQVVADEGAVFRGVELDAVAVSVVAGAAPTVGPAAVQVMVTCGLRRPVSPCPEMLPRR